jgi:hypothetical protein
MRVRIHMTSGDAVDAEQYSIDNGATWADIGVPQVVAAMGAQTGYTVVRDVLTSQWRAFRNVNIESIGPAGDIDQVINDEVERRIQAALAAQLPARVIAVAPTVPPPTPPPPPANPASHGATP